MCMCAYVRVGIYTRHALIENGLRWTHRARQFRSLLISCLEYSVEMIESSPQLNALFFAITVAFLESAPVNGGFDLEPMKSISKRCSKPIIAYHLKALQMICYTMGLEHL